jgi:tRNA A-37 threonylcarbamoyl transferase component Bud32/tetratricopeptide (TPR) repeat protein
VARHTTQERVSSDHAPEPPELIGRVIDDRYEVIERIGSGAMAQVYRAEHVHIRCSVAIKVIDPALAAVKEFARRFEREAIAIGRLDHPNCVGVLDFGRLPEGQLYLAMQMLRGPTLATVLHRGQIAPGRALHIARHVLSGLAHAHAASIIHRDIKPGNIILAEYEGDPDFARIVDFGVAKLVESLEDASDSQLTRIGQRFGTPQYMSPEQAVGCEVDARSDLYSVAVMLYQMLTGARPFESDDPMALLAKQAGEPAPTLRDAGAGAFTPELERLVANGLAKRADDRYTDAAAFMAAVDDCADQLRGVPQQAPTPRPWWRERRGMTMIGAGAAAALALFLYILIASGTDPAERASKLMSEGKPQAAVEYLEARGDDIAAHAAAQLQLGHAYAAVRDYAGALAAYRRAMDLDRDYEDDAQLRQNLLVMLEGDVDVAVDAATLLVTELRDDAARDRVVEQASRHDDIDHRSQMRALSESLGLGDRIDRVRSYKLDLRQARKCAARQAAVAKLRALGDAGAIPALKRARARKGNGCLKRDAEDAVRYLDAQALPPAE